MTIKERNRMDAKLKKMGRLARFIRRNVNTSLGRKLQDMVDDMWSEAFR